MSQPQGESQMYFPSSAGISVSNLIFLTQDLCTFISSVFVLVFILSEYAHDPFKSGFFFSFLDISLIDFQSHVFGSLFLLCRTYKLCCLRWSLDPLLLKKSFIPLRSVYETPQLVCSFFLSRAISLPSILLVCPLWWSLPS